MKLNFYFIYVVYQFVDAFTFLFEKSKKLAKCLMKIRKKNHHWNINTNWVFTNKIRVAMTKQERIAKKEKENDSRKKEIDIRQSIFYV